MKLSSPTFRRTAALALALGFGQAHAELSYDNNDFELFLVVLDQTNAQMTYVLDLGIKGKEFWVQGQQDNGSSLFRTLDPSADSAFQSFLGSANLTTTRWMVLGFNNSQVEGERMAFTTLTNNNSLPKQTAMFDRMKGMPTSTVIENQPTYIQDLVALQSAIVPGGVKISTHNSTANGSSLASKPDGNTPSYWNASLGFRDLTATGDGDCILAQYVCAGNPLGVSSWFYRLSPSLTDPADPSGGTEASDPVVLDEFDNLSGDGYWGFVKDPASSKYFLSYTLAGSSPTTLVSTADGRTRLSYTDYAAQYGGVHLINIGADDVAFNVGGAVSAVPEPQGWALMLGGLAAFAGLRRVRRSQA